MKAREVMSHPVITIRADAGLGLAADMLTRHGFTGLPVTDDDDHLVGIVTEADLLRERLDSTSNPNSPADEHFSWRRHRKVVGDVMTTSVESLTPGADTSELARLMLEERIRCVPIVDGRQILGIVTRRDLLRAGVIRSDADIATDISRELAAFSDADRWSVSVESGRAEIQDHIDSANDRQIAVRLAMALPGVKGAHAHYLTSDPF
ncbi:CBS domain-containing protein [Nakamurella sp. UYEF19]|uniref:CBS domain-containing protein n=1 Tax=Nakamurella sp. UYEF19 TaxID=1756392 RepID=UPI0033907936